MDFVRPQFLIGIVFNLMMYRGSLHSLSWLLSLANQIGSLVFDKDDDLAVEFVTAASNLRSLCYGIPEQVRMPQCLPAVSLHVLKALSVFCIRPPIGSKVLDLKN